MNIKDMNKRSCLFSCSRKSDDAIVHFIVYYDTDLTKYVGLEPKNNNKILQDTFEELLKEIENDYIIGTIS